MEICPKCGYKPTDVLDCKICNYSWKSRVNNPKECPSCKSRNWDCSDEPKEKEPTKLTKEDIISSTAKTTLPLHPAPKAEWDVSEKPKAYDPSNELSAERDIRKLVYTPKDQFEEKCKELRDQLDNEVLSDYVIKQAKEQKKQFAAEAAQEKTETQT